MDINYLGYAGPGGGGGGGGGAFLYKMFIYKYILLAGSWVRGGPGCLGIWVRDN